MVSVELIEPLANAASELTHGTSGASMQPGVLKDALTLAWFRRPVAGLIFYSDHRSRVVKKIFSKFSYDGCIFN